MGRASKLKQQRRQESHDGTNSTSSRPRYVLFESKSSNYLASLELLGGMERLNWCPHPGGALKFDSFSQAQAKAKRIAKQRGYSLEVVELNSKHVNTDQKP
ncbi:hypothetical protein BJP34_33935 [Moorena producens PAL-8-15-08-1]|uniref:Uncharacterized protein n=1 Tax=Moorena producens PAL-8-15-08-1 TaxID=1458985 RepID=A0A1D8U1J9_9CYAN|nr:hypothetical protein [Moorena producens]AOX03770.1 hypothetical protein BJP34_33935 [Moorena producens PAL-8-15-08-1]